MVRSRPPVSFGGALAVTLPAATAAALLFSPLVGLPLTTVWFYWPFPTLFLVFYLRAVWYICRGLPVKHRIGLRHVVAHTLALAAALLLFFGLFFLETRLAETMSAAPADWLFRSGSLVFMSGVVLAAYIVAVLAYYLGHQRGETQRLEAEILRRQIFANRAQLKNLESTIQPHFLFNILNLIRPLISREPEKAQAVIDHLSGFLQYTLRHLQMEWVSLTEEIEHAEHYLALERLRMGDRIRVSSNYPQDTDRLRVPPLVLLPLLENAVKHGFGTITEEGTLGIDITEEAGLIRIQIHNPFDPAAPRKPGGEGMGLSVLKQRLIGLYKQPIELTTEADSNNFIIGLALPVQRRKNGGSDVSDR